MGKKQLVTKKDVFILIEEELIPFVSKIIRKEQEIINNEDIICKEIYESLEYAQRRALARTLIPQYVQKNFKEKYKDSIEIGGFYIRGGGIPRSYNYKAETSAVHIFWLGNKFKVEAYRADIYPGQNIRVYGAFNIIEILNIFNRKDILSEAYKNFLSSFNIYIDEEIEILRVYKHKTNHLFIIVAKNATVNKLIFYNGKELLEIEKSALAIPTFVFTDKKLGIKKEKIKFSIKFETYLKFETKIKDNHSLIYDFLNQKVGAEYVRMLFYV